MTARQFLQRVKSAVPAAQHLVITAAPTGGLRIMQRSGVPDALVKSYADTLHAEDRVTWLTILEGQPVSLDRCGDEKDFRASRYWHAWLQAQRLVDVAAVPLAAPALGGYPGVLHLSRTEEQGPFGRAELADLVRLAREFDTALRCGPTRRLSTSCPPEPAAIEPPRVRLAVVDRHMTLLTPAGDPADVDPRLRDLMVQHARHRLGEMNGDSRHSARVFLADSQGDRWAFRAVTYGAYPALGKGAFTFFCFQPPCDEWRALEPAEFDADAELVRLIPALGLMRRECRRGITLVQIARAVHLSPFHFHRRFTKLFGLTPKQFLLDCQMHLAKSALLAGTKPLAVVATDCGFAHQSHFTVRFKQATGVTPSRWRRAVSARAEKSAD